MEPITTGLAIYALNSDVVKQLLGPTIEYIGNEGKNLVARCNINIEDIFTKATAKAAHKLEDDGQVNLRVLRGVMNDGAFCESEVVRDYYAGILASSRTSNVEDDRGVMFIDILSGLTTSQVKLHNLIYSSLLNEFDGETYFSKTNYGLFIPSRLFGTNQYIQSFLEHALEGLIRHRLVEPETSTCSSIKELKKYNSEINEEGFIINPSRTGETLYMWSLGKEDIKFIEHMNDVEQYSDKRQGLIKIQENIFVKTYKEAFSSDHLHPVNVPNQQNVDQVNLTISNISIQ